MTEAFVAEACAAEACVAEANVDASTRQLVRASSALGREVRKIAGTPWGPGAIGAAEVDVVRRLRQFPGSSVNQVAEALRVAPNTVSTLVRALVDHGIVDRIQDEQDRRVWRLDLTAQARSRVEAWQDERVAVVDAALARLDAGDRQALLAAAPALERLVDLIRERSS